MVTFFSFVIYLQHFLAIMLRKSSFLIPLCMLLPALGTAAAPALLMLPNQEQLPSGHVLYVMQDDEGALWYATEGGGLCRDDGCAIDVFRNEASRPDLLGSNNVACLAQMRGCIIVGTFHGACVLDKADFSIRRLEEVDDKRVDDILVTRNGDLLLTANKKIYYFDRDLHLVATYDAHGKYVSHLFEDASGLLWATLWGGGLLRCSDGAFRQMPWPLDVAPTDMADAADGTLWVGTAGRGIVRYDPGSGTTHPQPEASMGVCTDLQASADGARLWASTMGGVRLFRTGAQLTAAPTDSIMAGTAAGRMTLDCRGRVLVAAGDRPSYAVDDSETVAPAWAAIQTPTDFDADSVRLVWGLTTRPTAWAADDKGCLWFSTGHDIRRAVGTAEDVVVLPNMADVSAMAFTTDGTLWLGTIYGMLHALRNGRLTTDDYAANEHGDAVVALCGDSCGRLVIAHERYVRLYDPARHTLRQRSIEAEGAYSIEMHETQPGRRWCQPQRGMVVERMPQWLTAWWMCVGYTVVAAMLILLLIHYYILRRQSRRFIAQIKELKLRTIADTASADAVQRAAASQDAESYIPETTHADEEKTGKDGAVDGDSSNSKAIECLPFLRDAMACVEKHLSDDAYNVELLSRDLCVSRMTLYRKIQGATGQSPTEFIRTVRLRHAAEMLLRGDMSVKEISYSTGFSSVSYFSRCFRTMYGVPPTQFGSATTADVRDPRRMPSDADEVLATSTPESE